VSLEIMCLDMLIGRVYGGHDGCCRVERRGRSKE
jgi:hypothetical protein